MQWCLELLVPFSQHEEEWLLALCLLSVCQGFLHTVFITSPFLTLFREVLEQIRAWMLSPSTFSYRIHHEKNSLMVLNTNGVNWVPLLLLEEIPTNMFFSIYNLSKFHPQLRCHQVGSHLGQRSGSEASGAPISLLLL